MKDNDKFSTFKFVIMILAIWLMVSSFFISSPSFSRINFVVVGILFFIFSLWLRGWQKWFILISGLLIISVSFTPLYVQTITQVTSGATDTQISVSKALTWNIIIGIITLLVIFVPERIED